MEKPKLSIVIPVHNAEKLIQKTAKQILNQNYPNFELVLVENGSKDHTWELCQAIGSSDPRVRTIRSEPGTSLARKAGILESTGEWITFSDQDDRYVDSNALSGMMCAVEKLNSDIVQFNFIQNTFGRKKVVGVDRSYTIDRNELLQQGIEGILGAYKADFGTTVWRKVYRAEILKHAASKMKAALFRGEDMYLNGFAFMDNGIQHCSICTNAYYVWNTGIGTSSSKDCGTALFQEYRIIKPTLLSLAKAAGVGYEPIMRSHLETLYFLNALIRQSIIEEQSREETICLLKEYASWDFVREAAAFFAEKRPNGMEWDEHIKKVSRIDEPEQYYDRVYTEIGNVKLARIKARAKRIVKTVLATVLR